MSEKSPAPPSNRLAIVTNAGGPGIMATDACESRGLVVTPLSEATMEKLRGFLPSEASVKNPVDMIAKLGASRRVAKLRRPAGCYRAGSMRRSSTTCLTYYIWMASISGKPRFRSENGLQSQSIFSCPPIWYSQHLEGSGRELFENVRAQIGAIVSKRAQLQLRLAPEQ